MRFVGLLVGLDIRLGVGGYLGGRPASFLVGDQACVGNCVRLRGGLEGAG
jgi:hypothetical protein